MRWYVSRAGATQGPFEEDQVREMAKGNQLDKAQVRDEEGGASIAAEKSPFGALMKQRGMLAPVVCGLVVAIAGTVIINPLAGVLAGVVTFGLLALVRRL